jgi:hypothetical protein
MQKAWQLATQAMEEDRGALLAISDRRPKLRAKEADLQKLREARAVVAVKDVDSEVHEVDEEEEASNHDNNDPCAVTLKNLEARYEAWKGAFTRFAPQRSMQLRMRCAPLPWR